jgi:hypothetical protein
MTTPVNTILGLSPSTTASSTTRQHQHDNDDDDRLYQVLLTVDSYGGCFHFHDHPSQYIIQWTSFKKNSRATSGMMMMMFVVIRCNARTVVRTT